MKILVVGSKGFIGSHCLRYLEGEHDVWGCDVFTDYNEKKFILLDALSLSYHSLFQDNSFDICINCAGAASVPDSLKFPERDYELNTHLVFKLLNAIKQFSSKCKFISISSAAVYGNPQKLPVSEEHILNPISPYGRHKKYSEELCEEYYTYFGIATCCVRIFSAFGPGLKKQIFWDLYLKSKEAAEVHLAGSGEETRDYVFISDIVSALNCIIRNGAFEGECYNLGSGIQYALRDVAELFYTHMDWYGRIVFSGIRRTGDPDNWQADIGKLKKIGFAPKVSIGDGIKEYSVWLKNLQ